PSRRPPRRLSAIGRTRVRRSWLAPRRMAGPASSVSLLFGRLSRRLGVAIGLALASVAPAADNGAAWQGRVGEMSEGLAGNNLAGIVETKDGFLWTLAGSELVRFDGVDFKHVPAESFAGGSPRRIREFVQTRDGGLAFGMYDGTIVRVNAGKVSITPDIL